ncbi:hypothetical protein JCM10296v2_004743 [Rhodotorula toruloides]
MDASNLQAVLALFPAVKVLHLEKLNYQHQDYTLYALYYNAKEPILRAICNNNLLIHFPAITAMLSFLMHTNVLRLRHSTLDIDGITWTRHFPAPADSTVLTVSSDEEPTSSARREGSQEPSSPPRVSLTSLPTELLDKIFSYHDEITWEGVKRLLINKRLFALAYSHWLQYFAVDPDQNGAILAELVTNRQTACRVEDLHLNLPPIYPEYHCAIFRNTLNLTSLRILIHDEDAYFTIPDCFFRALRGLHHLRYLKVDYDERDQPVNDFSFERDVPSLRQLDIDAEGSLAACAPGLSKLDSLNIYSFSFAGAGIPWRTLRRLDMRRHHGEGRRDDADLQDLVQSLEVACGLSPIPLQSLTLSFKGRGKLGLIGLTKIAAMLSAPHLNDLTIFDIESLSALASWTFDVRLPSIGHLTLISYCDCISVDDLRGLRAILALCPAVEVLRMEYFRISANENASSPLTNAEVKEAILRSFEVDTLAFLFPELAALLFSLQPTSILDLNISSWYGNEVRWSRSARNEVFKAEGWTVI